MNEIPISLFIFLALFMFACAGISVSRLHIINIVAGMLGVIVAYVLSKISINGMLVMQFGGITSTDSIVTDSVSIYNSPQSYIFLFIAIILLGITIINILSELKYTLEPDIGDLDFE